MVRYMVFAALAACSTTAVAAGNGGGGPIIVPPKVAYVDPSLRPIASAVVPTFGRAAINLGSISKIGAKWGRVTSTLRSVAHNKAVGGVPNSFHLSGRAIDIARRTGVSHGQIAADLRKAGYNLIESLDEGDHSHFAFGRPGEVRIAAPPPKPQFLLAQDLFPVPKAKDSLSAGGQ